MDFVSRSQFLSNCTDFPSVSLLSPPEPPCPVPPPAWLQHSCLPLAPRVFILIGAASRGAAEPTPLAPQPPCSCASPSGSLGAPGSGCPPYLVTPGAPGAPSAPPHTSAYRPHRPRSHIASRPSGPAASLGSLSDPRRRGLGVSAVHSLVLSPCA